MQLKPSTLFNGDFIAEKVQARVWNRTGGTLTNGDLVAFNLDFASTSGQAMVGLNKGVDDDATTGYIVGAAIALTTENMARIVGVADDPSKPGSGGIADNTEFLITISGLCNVNMNGANAGEFIVGTNAQKYATPYTLTELDSLSVPTGIIGIALDATSSTQVKRALIDGRAFLHLIGGGG